MPKFLIQRDLPGAGNLTEDELQAISAKSNDVLAGMSPRAKWLHSYVTDDQIVCLYVADDEEAVLEHGRCGGFPVNKVSRVRNVIDPATGEKAA